MTDENARGLPAFLVLTALLLVHSATSDAARAFATSGAENNLPNVAVVDDVLNKTVASTPFDKLNEEPNMELSVLAASAEESTRQPASGASASAHSNATTSSLDMKHINASVVLPASGGTNSSSTTFPTPTTAPTSHDANGSTTPTTTTAPSPYIKNVYLWTRGYKDGDEYELLDPYDEKSLQSSHFLPATPTFVLVHGYLAHGLYLWIQEAKRKLLGLSNCNVLSIDWDAGNKTTQTEYNETTGRVPHVGSDAARLLLSLHTVKQLDSAHTHLIGHCLGAHVAGFAGKKSHSPIGRITGLDPAGVNYRDTEANVRLSKSDAVYVDIIHSNGCHNPMKWTDCFGFREALGDTDFFPNGGDYQPACGKAGHKRRKGQLGCDHQMAHDYYVESLDYGVDDTLFLARPAETYHQYCTDPVIQCGHYPQYMGYNAIPDSIGRYYFNTTHEPPFAVLDPACPSRLSYRLSIGSSVSAIVALIAMAVLIVLPAVLLLLRYVMSNVSLHTGTSYSTLVDDGNNDIGATAGQQRVHTYSPRNAVVIPDSLDDDGVETRVITDDPLLTLRRHIENESETADDLDNLDMFSATDEFPNARLPLISDFGPNDVTQENDSAAGTSQDACGADQSDNVLVRGVNNRQYAGGIYVDPALAPFVDVSTVDVTLSD